MSPIKAGCLGLLALIASIVLSIEAMSKPMPEERMKFLMQWAGQATGLSTYNVELPLIVYMTDEQLQISYHGDAYFRYKDNPTVNLLTVLATYDMDTQIMSLSSEVDYTDPHNEVVVLHELAHHLQAVHGVEYQCFGALEPDAYRVQSLWVQATGYGIKPDPLTVMLISQCDHGH